MKKIVRKIRPLSLLFFASILINFSAIAQCGSLCGPNLLPNPSFETTTACGGGNTILFTDKSPIQDWWGLACSSCANSGSTPDNFNSNCAGTNSTMNCGNGTGSVGMYTTFAGRESVQAKLTSALKAGHQYCFSMKVRTNGVSASSNGIGAWFHNKGKLNVDVDNGGNQFLGAGTILNASPQVQNPTGTMIGNTCVTVTGTFCATGGESWIVISNFRTNAGTTVGSGNGTGSAAYLIVDEISLKENNCLITTPITTSADSVCPNSCVTLTAHPSGGSGTYHYQWSPGTAKDTLSTFQACPTADATKYKCSVTTSLGCAISAAVTDSITIYFKKYIPVPTIATSVSPTICSGDTITLTCTPAAPNYKWSTGATTQSIKVTTAGTYSVTVKHPYSGCNSTSAGTTVVVNSLPVLNLSGLKNDSTSCDKPDGSIKGIVATGKPTLTYLWTPTNQTTPDLLNVTAGTYKLTVTDGNGCQKSTTATIAFKPNPPAPVIDLNSATTTICSESDITLSVTNPDPTYTYTWTQLPNNPKGTGSTLLIKNATVNETGYYTVSATKFGCTGAKDTIKVTVNQTPDTVAVKAVAPVVCEGTKAVLYASPAANPDLTYKWISPDDPKTPPVYNDTLTIDKTQLKDAGVYTLIVSSKLSCPSHGAHIKLVVDSAAKSSKISLSSAFVCEGDTVTIKPATPTPGITYKIYVKSTTGTDSLIGVAPLNVVPHKTTKYYMDAVTTKGCSQTSEKDTATIGVYTAPVVPIATATDTIICDNDSTIISVLNTVGGVVYKVYDALTNGNFLGNTPYKVILHKTTTFYIEAVSSKSCIQITGRRPITIKVNPLPARPKISVESKPDNKLCNGETAKLTSSISDNITWSLNNLHTQSITVDKGGIYTVYYTDPNGCRSANDSVLIKLVEPPKLDVSNYEIDTVRCNATIGGVHGLVVNSGTGPFTYNWFNVTDPKTTVSTDLTLKGVPFGKYTLVVTDKNGCTDVLSNVVIPTKGGIVAHLSATPTSGAAPLDVFATTTITGVGKPIDYVWYLDGHLVGTTNEKTNTFSFNDLPFGNHVIQVNVRDTNQCKSVDYVTIMVLTSSKIHDVNIFTPNNDGHNDILIFPTEGIQSLQGVIYDRWGLKLFEWSGADKGWDGNDQGGKACPEGTYYYILKTTDVYGGGRVKSGYVELIRK